MNLEWYGRKHGRSVSHYYPGIFPEKLKEAVLLLTRILTKILQNASLKHYQLFKLPLLSVWINMPTLSQRFPFVGTSYRQRHININYWKQKHNCLCLIWIYVICQYNSLQYPQPHIQSKSIFSAEDKCQELSQSL